MGDAGGDGRRDELGPLADLSQFNAWTLCMCPWLSDYTFREPVWPSGKALSW